VTCGCILGPRAVRVGMLCGMLLAVLWLPVSAWAQSSQASLQGQVMNPASGEPIARALVIQRNILTNTQGYRYTNEQGFFSFPALPSGTYTVRVDALGFQPEERSGVELPVAGRVEMNFALTRSGEAPLQPSTTPAVRPGENPRNILAVMYGADAAVPQAILIRLPVSQVETVVGAISSLIDENKILELPLAGRDVYTLLVLQPDVSSDNATARGLGFSVNGQQSGSSNFLLDGVDNNDLQVTGPAAKVSADAVKEYRMSTNNFTAEFGRNAGFIANAITRSGTNRFHGSLFEFFNHDALNANSFSNNWQDLKKERNELNQYGGTLGGPVVADRLFFFGGFEQLRTSTESQPLELLVPTPLLISLAAPGSIAAKLWSLFPPPAGDPLPGGAVALQEFRFPLTQRNSFAIGRADYNSLDGRNRVSSRYSFAQNTQDDFAVSNYPAFNAPLVLRGQGLGLNYTREAYGGTNELKFGFNRNSVSLIRPHPEIPTLVDDGTDVTLPGSSAAYDYLFRDTVFHVVDNYSRLSRSHALIFGFEWRPYLHDSLLSAGRDGQYNFGSVIDFLDDVPYAFKIAINRETGLPAVDADFWRYYFHNEGAAFFQDNWKLTRRLTLNLGMRWEYFGAPSLRKGTEDHNFVFGPGNDVTQGLASGRMQAGPLFRPDRNNFAPRFGFALDLLGTGRSVLRGGYGVYFDRIFNNFWMDARANNLTLQSYSNLNPFQPPQFEYAVPARSAKTNLPDFVPVISVAVDQNLRTPYVQSWFLGVQQQVSENLVLEANHTGAVGRKLAAADVINRLRSVPITAANPTGRFNPDQPDISYRGNQGTSDHVALQVGLSRRWAQGMQFQASYTWGRSRDVQSDPLGRKVSVEQDRRKRLAEVPLFDPGPRLTLQFDPRADYGHSDFDQRHNLIFNFVGQVPKMPGLPPALSGWQASVITAFRSGFPFSATAEVPGDDGSLFFVPGSGYVLRNRADYWGGERSDAFLEAPDPIPGGVILLDRAKFSAPPSDRLGNSSRNAFFGPGLWNVDVALSRSFVLLAERASVQFRIEMFNAFNNTNLNNPSTNVSAQFFGEALYGRQGVGSSNPAASPLNEQARRIQLAVKVYF
jgi:hypothetical protein